MQGTKIVQNSKDTKRSMVNSLQMNSYANQFLSPQKPVVSDSWASLQRYAK